LIEFDFTTEEVKNCKDFAGAMDTSLYAKRNRSSDEKRTFDSYIGKLGEVAVYKYLKDKVPELTYPDFKIYKAKEKSWDFDLKGHGYNIHVKTQDLAQGEKYGTSWIFQYGNGSNRNYDKEIFDQTASNQWVAFVSLDNSKPSGVVRAFVPLSFLHEKNLWAKPVLKHLQFANKLAIYLKDLEFYQDRMFPKESN